MSPRQNVRLLCFPGLIEYLFGELYRFYLRRVTWKPQVYGLTLYLINLRKDIEY